MTSERGVESVTLRDLQWCFEGAIPAILATSSAAGIPNVTYLSRVRQIDDHHVALSNQFFSKTSRNLAENARASLILTDPKTYDEYRLTLRYTRTVRSGELFHLLSDDVDDVAALTGMQDVFKLRAADIYRVVEIERMTTPVNRPALMTAAPSIDVIEPDPVTILAGVADLAARLGRCTDLDSLVGATVDGLADVLGYEHSLLMLLDESGKQLYTIASHGYEDEGVGSEMPVGEGTVGMAAARATPIRITNLRQMQKYARSVRRSYEDHGGIRPGREVPMPGLAAAGSRLAVPAMALGQVIGVLMVESPHSVAFSDLDEAVLTTIASVVASAVEAERTRDRIDEAAPSRTVAASPAATPADPAHVRFFAVDGSTFLDGDYLIKGVAGRILWSLLRHHEEEQRIEFTNREARLDPALELPQFRDNFESRLILLKRRLDERHAPIRIEKTGRGRFRLTVERSLRLDLVPADR